MNGKMNSKTRYVRCPRCRNVLPEPTDVPVYKCGGCNATLQVKKRNNNNKTVNTESKRPDDDSLGKQKVEQVFGDQEAGSKLNQQLMHDSGDESDHDHDDLHNKADNDSVQAYLFGKLKLKQLSNDHEASSSSSNQHPVVNNNIHNDPRSSTELSGHEDPESSPDAMDHNRVDQEEEQNQNQNQNQDPDACKKQENTTVDATSIDTDQITKMESLNQQLMVNSIDDLDQYNNHDEPHNSYEFPYDNGIDEDSYHDDLDQEFLSCRHDDGFEESGSEFDEAFANSRSIRDSDRGSNSKSSFKSFIAEKLLDTRLKKPMHRDEDNMLSEDESENVHHHRRFDHINSIETTETARLYGKSFYEYEGSVSSFDGNDNHTLTKPRFGLIGDENVGSGNGYRFNRIHPSNGFNSNHRLRTIAGNPKTERIELLKLVRKLQDQLERTNISNSPQVPLYNNHVFNNQGRYGTRMAFSGETTAVNGGSCPHCRPQDRHFSAQLPRQHVCCNGPHYEPNGYYSPRFSALSSPIHNHSEPEFSALVTKPVRSPKKKRYVRPIAGGSPWIACYRCSKLLELPQSFLVFNKKYHSLQCGACLKVLNFTLSNGTHVSRYYPEETIAAPPSSEAGDYDGLNGPWAGPVSCSDSSFQKSYSTETDIIGSREFSVEKRKSTMSRDPSGSTHPSSSRASGQRKMTSGSKGERGPNGSPLHRLMGYASVSRVIRS